ncbi:MurR/RpiR family transcriptional regulator [Agrobacterium tumefaciens]|uniref:MurR/RpiR family transcriptional regulator n=1 Tax=Agrobacterium tumefaciens TaxID=358 RepID=UPI001574801A|nr:MurR/RpiR family transcriptional regulator [Agrobacterium tumefaciens]NTE68270.1 MurR/RpiR family transcriptional regulator [Agrobacterium tumefaciens]
MPDGPLTDRLIAQFADMSDQFQLAARYIIDQPNDVALLSMRDQARLAGVQPATMTRLAKHLGLSGYDEIRELYAEAVRGGGSGFAGKASDQVLAQKLKGDHGLAAEILTSQASQILLLTESEQLNSIVDVARMLASARRVFCLGLRSSHPVAWHLHYMLTMIGDKSIMLDAIGGIGADAFASASSDDVFLAVSVLPYTRATVEMAEYAHARNIPVVAITDSEVAPLVQFAVKIVVAQTKSPSFLHTMAPAFAVAEVLGALIAGQDGEKSRDALSQFDANLSAFNTHLKPRPSSWSGLSSPNSKQKNRNGLPKISKA